MPQQGVSVSGGQSKHLPNLLPDGLPARWRYVSSFVAQEWGVNGPEYRAITKSFPTKTIFRIQHDLEWVGIAALALAGAEKGVEDLRPGATVGVRDQDNRVQALFWKIAIPNLELRLHFGPLTQPDKIANSSLSRCGVKYLSNEPGGNASLCFCGTSRRPRISPPSTRHSTWSWGLRPTAWQTASGMVVRRFLSINVACIEGLSLRTARTSSFFDEPESSPKLLFQPRNTEYGKEQDVSCYPHFAVNSVC